MTLKRLKDYCEAFETDPKDPHHFSIRLANEHFELYRSDGSLKAAIFKLTDRGPVLFYAGELHSAVDELFTDLSERIDGC